ncbi:MAG: acylphosphatase, partial [Candidatus Ratteibacteria bacterium]
MKRYHIYISGRVQGVGFRWYAQRIAKNIDILGWVKNLPDGKVEIIAEGNEENLERFIEELKKGYLGGNIRNIEKIEEKYTGEFKNFQIRF